jgi:Kef-type K+ transport system membrane component KefB
MGALASPTDPSAMLAVTHEYKALGDVTSTIMGVAALDDVTGIMNFSVAVVLAQAMVLHEHFSVAVTVLRPVGIIFGAIGLGALFGAIFLLVMRLIYREGEGFMIVAVFALTTLCYGAARLLQVEELLSTMTMGVIVVNFSPIRDAIFSVLERYTEELVFVIFFTLSGMYLNFSVLGTSLVLVLFFIIFRFAGKFVGVYLGARLADAPQKVRRYTAGGLIPQGGIVIGLALLVKANTAFHQISDVIVSIIIGACVIHELAGPILARFSLSRAQELHKEG